MTVSILDDCLKLNGAWNKLGRQDDIIGSQLQEYFHSIGLELFDPIFHNSQNTFEASRKVLFILCAYSEDSPLIILRQDSKEEKEAICEYLGIPDFMRKHLMDLQEPEVRKATTQYLSQFAGPLFKSLMFMKIQYNDFDLDITNRAFSIKKTDTDKDGNTTSTEVYDSKEHMKAVNELAKLARNIDALEKQLRTQVKRMEGIEDLKEFTRTSKESGKMKGGRTGNVEGVIN